MLPVTEATANIPWDPRDWVELTPAFGRLRSMVAPTGPKLIANNLTATYFDRCVHNSQLLLALVAPDLTYRIFDDAAERQKLHIRVPLNYKEGCGIEPPHEWRWYAQRSGIEKLTGIPVTTPAPPAEAPKLSGKRWVLKAYARRSDDLLAMGITGASEALAEESGNAADCAKRLTARYIEKLLRELGAFPKAHRGSPKQRPK